MDEEEFQALLGNLPDEAPSVDPAPIENKEEPSGGVGQFVSDVVTKDAPQALENTWESAKGAGRAIAGIPEAVGEAVRASSGGSGDFMNQLAIQLGSKFLEGKTPEEAKQLAVKMGLGTAGGALGMALAPSTGGMSLALPILGGVAGAQVGQEVSEALDYEPDTPMLSSAKAHQAIQNLFTQVIGQGLTSGGGALLAKGGSVMKSLSTAIEHTRDLKRMDPDAIAGAFTVGSRVADTALKAKMREGAPTFARVFLDEIKGAKNAVAAEKSLRAAITKRSQDKARAFSFIKRQEKRATGTPNEDAFLFSEGELGLGRAMKEARSRADGGGIGAEGAALERDIYSAVTNEFSKDSPTPVGFTRIKTKKTFEEMQTALDNTYEELRKLRKFDDAAARKVGSTPSAAAQVEDLIKAHENIANGIKKAMDNRITLLQKKGLVPGSIKETILTANSEIHDLMPFLSGLDRFVETSGQALLTDPPRSLAQKPGSLFGRGTSKISQGLDMAMSPLVEPLVEKSANMNAVNFGPNQLSEVGKISELMTGQRAPVSPVPGHIPGVTGYGVGVGMETAGNALSGVSSPPLVAGMAGAQAPTFDPNDYDSVSSNPAFSQMLQSDPDISDDTKIAFSQTANGSQYEKNMALGKLKIEARNKGWFPPPEMQGIHSFIKLPKAEYRGEKVIGTITDQAEGALFLDALNEIPDVEKRAKLKSAFNSSGKYVLEIPSTLRARPTPEKSVQKKEPEPVDDTNDTGSSTAKISLGSGQGNMERVVHDY